jgi:hypothetical protein
MTLPQELRLAILNAPLETSNFGETPEATTLYLPPSHLKALRLDAHIVVGGRGVGKSFWTSALQSELLRRQLGAEIAGLTGVEVAIGFSGQEKIDNYPNADVFSGLVGRTADAYYDLWRAVVLRWVARKSGNTIPCESWPVTVGWLQSKPEEAARLMQTQRNWRGLILFDALDRTSNDWQQMDEIVRGLLRTVLWLKSFAGLHAKVFLRVDQAERTVFNFPDASKLTATKADLSWAKHDLHGMLWQRLINAPGDHGERVRSILKAGFQRDTDGDVWRVTHDMKSESESQKKAFEKLAGPWMGRDRRRGVPYSWSVGHLADGRGQTSPRSFLAAIEQAAQDSSDRYVQHEYALHYESIKRGIQKASEIRVQEIAEDYPWVPAILSALSGMNVPIDFGSVKKRWEERFPEGPESISQSSLPAQHVTNGWVGVGEDLSRLGLLETKKDRRIDMPDLYRVGFGLGRKGGVKPKN